MKEIGTLLDQRGVERLGVDRRLRLAREGERLGGRRNMRCVIFVDAFVRAAKVQREMRRIPMRRRISRHQRCLPRPLRTGNAHHWHAPIRTFTRDGDDLIERVEGFGVHDVTSMSGLLASTAFHPSRRSLRDPSG